MVNHRGRGEKDPRNRWQQGGGFSCRQQGRDQMREEEVGLGEGNGRAKSHGGKVILPGSERRSGRGGSKMVSRGGGGGTGVRPGDCGKTGPLGSARWKAKVFLETVKGVGRKAQGGM